MSPPRFTRVVLRTEHQLRILAASIHSHLLLHDLGADLPVVNSIGRFHSLWRLWHDGSPEEAFLLSGPRFAAHDVYSKNARSDEELLYLVEGDWQSGSPRKAAMLYVEELISDEAFVRG